MTRVTAPLVRAALKERFRAPEWAIFFEVLDATGAAHRRSADAVAMSLWPSRGLELWGMEIKVYRADWLKERQDPTKAETIAKYCDRWFLVTGPGVVQDSSEVPPAWGWMVFDGKALTTVREAQKTEAATLDRRFLAALLRRADVTDTGIMEAEIARRMEKFEESFGQRLQDAVERRTRDATGVLKDVEAFERESGLKLSSMRGFFSDAAELGRAVAVIRKSGLTSTWSNLYSLAEGLRAKAEDIEKAAREVGFLPPEKPAAKRRAS